MKDTQIVKLLEEYGIDYTKIDEYDLHEYFVDEFKSFQTLRADRKKQKDEILCKIFRDYHDLQEIEEMAEKQEKQQEEAKKDTPKPEQVDHEQNIKNFLDRKIANAEGDYAYISKKVLKEKNIKYSNFLGSLSKFFITLKGVKYTFYAKGEDGYVVSN